MRLLHYKMIEGPRANAMDSYYHLMFAAVIPSVDRRGNITQPMIPKTNLNKLKDILTRLTKEHPVSWELKVSHRAALYDFKAEGGKVSYKIDRSNQNALG